LNKLLQEKEKPNKKVSTNLNETENEKVVKSEKKEKTTPETQTNTLPDDIPN